jgi:hypothetical protein
VYRDTEIASNGGFRIGNGSLDVLIESSTIEQSGGADNCIEIDSTAEFVYVSNTTCT